jgi:hypothetical protein
MKSEAIKQEQAKLLEIFKDCDSSQKVLIQGLIEQAAYLYVENKELQKLLETTGMVRTHPSRPEFQKQVPAAKEYRSNATTYSVIIKTLNQILQQNVGIGEDPFDEWLRQQNEKQDTQPK